MKNVQTNAPKTLLELSGFDSKAGKFSQSVLVIIDAQKEFTEGNLKLDKIDAAIEEARILLERARKLRVPVIHVKHRNKSGAALFAPESEFFADIDQLKPETGETVIFKPLANAFANSNLDEELQKIDRKNLIVCGFMTHMAVDATVRAALERGYQTTVVGDACATRDLSDGYGKIISARQMQTASLAALRDRFAAVVKSEREIPD